MDFEDVKKNDYEGNEDLTGDLRSSGVIKRDRERKDPMGWVSSTTIKFSLALNVLLLAFVIQQKLSTLNASSNLELMMPKLANYIADPCSGHGDLESVYETDTEACVCHACFAGKDCSMPDSSCVIDLNQGDPKIFEKYWQNKGHASTTVLLGWQRMSYYANSKQFFFVQTELDRAIRSVHEVVGNAVTEGRHIVIGTGSTQLFQAALYSLASPSGSKPTRVVSLAPYYSAYPAVTDYLKSAMYKWGGDAAKFKEVGQDAAYIELVTTPNNPSGEVRYPVVNGTGAAVHDLAYYWPHYTPITSPADDDLMLFTLSKSTGHAGTRIGWAIVKDLNVAQKMAKFIELNTIGVSKDAQIRATQILRFATKEYRGSDDVSQQKLSLQMSAQKASPGLFHFGSAEMGNRWMRLRSVLQGGVQFSLPDFQPAFCTFLGKMGTPTPAFAWLHCNQEDDCSQFLKRHGILARGGVYFGADARFVRLSMMDRRTSFDILIGRLEALELGGS